MTIIWAAVFLVLTNSTPATPEPNLRVSLDVNAPIARVWNAWTTQDGIRTFFAPGCRVELKPLGAYEIYFDPSAEPGLRGADDCMLLAVQEPTMLSFTWNAPPQHPTIRQHRTSVVVRMQELSPARTRVTLTHTGWGTGAEWDAVRAYLEKAWGEHVMPLLKYSLEVAPVDWKNLKRDLEAAQAAMK